MRELLKNKEFMGSEDLQKRLAVFLQTKPFMENIGEKMDISGYYLYLINSWMHGKTYGGSAHDADIGVKKDKGIDAEAIIDGNLHSNARSTPRKDLAA